MPDNSTGLVLGIDDVTGGISWYHAWFTPGALDKLFAVAASDDVVVAVGTTTGRPLIAGAFAFPDTVEGQTLGVVIGMDTADGAELWGLALGTSTSTGQVMITSVDINARGTRVVIAGQFFDGDLELGDGVTLSGDNSADATFMFIAVYSLDGTTLTHLWYVTRPGLSPRVWWLFCSVFLLLLLLFSFFQCSFLQRRLFVRVVQVQGQQAGTNRSRLDCCAQCCILQVGRADLRRGRDEWQRYRV